VRLCVVGLGKLGAPLAAVLADAGHEVIGVDLSSGAVDAVNAGTAPVPEPGLQELIERARVRLRATTSVRDAVVASEATFVIVPTPSGPDATFVLDHVLAAIDDIGHALRDSEEWHLVTITSTVMPGATGGPIRERLESASGRTVGRDLGLCYSPEFIALGTVIRDMTEPDLLLVGESDPLAGDVLEKINRSAVRNSPPAQRMSLVDAEITKIAINTFVTTKISFANMLSELCDELPGADVDAVTDAVGLDSRIGRKYLRGGAAYGGPCFPRDNRAISALAHSLGLSAAIADATDAVNDRQATRLARVVAEAAPSGRVAVLGLSYKPGTPVIDRSAGVDLAIELVRQGRDVVVHDPMALDEAARFLPGDVRREGDLDVAISGSSVLVITTPWPEYRELAKRAGRGTVIVDLWGHGGDAAADVHVVRPGRAPSEGWRDRE
jgi:UDPglucose 6-dehydrogenase